jgi:hypothetical protein
MSNQLSPGDIVRTTVKWAVPTASQIQNVFHWIVDGVENIDFLDAALAIRDQIDAAWTLIDDHLDDAMTLVEGIIYLLEWSTSPTPGWYATQYVGTFDDLDTFTPSAETPPMPAAVSMLLRFPTDVPKHEKRTYIGGFTEVATDNNDQWISTLMDAATVAASTLLSGIDVPENASDLMPVVPDVNQEIYRYYGSAIIRSRPHYQRRRQLYVGV